MDSLPFPERDNILLTGRLRDLEYVEFPDSLSSTEALVTRPARFSAGHPSVQNALIGLYPDRFHVVWVKHGERTGQTPIPFETIATLAVKPMRWPPLGRKRFRKMSVTGVSGVVEHWRVDYRFAANAEHVYRRRSRNVGSNTREDDRPWSVQEGGNEVDGYHVVGYSPFTTDPVLRDIPDLYGPYATLEDAKAVVTAKDPTVRPLHEEALRREREEAEEWRRRKDEGS